MTEARASVHRHVVLYDGVCGLCARVVTFTIKRDPEGRFAYAALQSEWAREHLEPYGRDPAALDSFFVLADAGTADERLLDRSDAALFLAGAVGWPWRAARAFVIVPKVLRDLAYRGIARIRYRVFGKKDACPIPTPAQRARFLDAAADE